MTASLETSPLFLRWSQHVPSSDVLDPLGLELRGSARLGSELLYCITSITPRARYFSYIPWCIYDYQQHEKGLPYALGLRDAIVLREQGLTLGCIAHHKGKPCEGGALIGSRDAIKWFVKGHNQANFRKMKKFSKNPAMAAYFNSLVNLGFFVTPEPLPDVDDESNTDDLTFDSIELTKLGLDLAKRYESAVGKIKVRQQLVSKDRACSLYNLAELGKLGGLCELSNDSSSDRELLREIFFGLVETKGESHQVRRQSLLLILELCRQLSSKRCSLNGSNFAAAVYFGVIVEDGTPFQVTFPKELLDIATRWRMFYFHYYMSVALEGMFAWLVSHLGELRLEGATIDSLTRQLGDVSLRRNLSSIFEIRLQQTFADMTPATFFSVSGLTAGNLEITLSRNLDAMIRGPSPLAENVIESLIRSNKYLYSSTGFALPLILLATTLARFTQWETTNYGHWLADVASDPFLDLVPPLLTTGLARRFGDWWNCTWQQTSSFVLSRYIIQQHQSMSYEKTSTGDRCLLQIDGQKVFSPGGFDEFGIGNPRLGSAIQILKDIGLLEDDEDTVTRLTTEGKKLLNKELRREVNNEIS